MKTILKHVKFKSKQLVALFFSDTTIRFWSNAITRITIKND